MRRRPVRGDGSTFARACRCPRRGRRVRCISGSALVPCRRSWRTFVLAPPSSRHDPLQQSLRNR